MSRRTAGETFVGVVRVGVLLGLGAMIIGCVSLEVVAPPVTPAMATAARSSEAVLREGRRLFAGPCANCHAPDPVSRYSLPEWRRIVDDMAPRARLAPGESAALLAYISAVKAVGTPSPQAPR